MYLSAPSSAWAFYSPRTSLLHLPNGTAVAAQLMSTPAERAAGQQFRSEPSVMLFLHPTAGRYTYHMINVGFPLELLFLGSAGTLASVQHAQPGRNFYTGFAKAVLEAPSGFVSANNLKVGDVIRF
jgi:uncharacterized membrane protein (UPF0127 family)